MDLSNGGGGSGEERTCNFQKGKKQYHRRSRQQTQQLEDFFKECPHPDKNQTQQLSRELGLDPKQIQFWFQNKRTQMKAYNEKAENNSLRTENERITSENLALQEALKTTGCPYCNGSGHGEDAQNNLLQMRIENMRLKEQHEQTSMFGNSMGNSSLPTPVMANHLPSEEMGPATLNHGHASQYPENPITPPLQSRVNEMDISRILQAALSAINELMYLTNVNEPMWVQAPEEGRYTLHYDSYYKCHPHLNHVKSSSARFESSKESGVVEMDAIHLIEILLDANKWKDTFPTIVNQARTVEVVGTDFLGGSLQLMYEKLHVLSPIVAPREFLFIRYCRKFTLSDWVMVDVSYDFIKESHGDAPSRAWKLPSGCVIKDLSNGKSHVTWIEHVQVDDKSYTHRMYRDLVCTSQAYGARRWIASLQRMCERYVFSMGFITAPRHVVGTPVGERNLMKLSHRMVKNFSEALVNSVKRGFTQTPGLKNSGIQVSFRNSNEPGQLNGFVACASTSIWLPLPKENLFEFLKDEKNREKWHVLSGGNPVNAVARISSGTHPGNCISVLKPFLPEVAKMLMLQESSIDPLGGMIVYAPIELPLITSVINGEDTMKIQILPSGLTISGDGREKKATGASSSSNTNNFNGSIMTLAFQILVSRGPITREANMELVATLHSLVSSSVQKIKGALHISDEG